MMNCSWICAVRRYLLCLINDICNMRHFRGSANSYSSDNSTETSLSALVQKGRNARWTLPNANRAGSTSFAVACFFLDECCFTDDKMWDRHTDRQTGTRPLLYAYRGQRNHLTSCSAPKRSVNQRKQTDEASKMRFWRWTEVRSAKISLSNFYFAIWSYMSQWPDSDSKMVRCLSVCLTRISSCLK